MRGQSEGKPMKAMRGIYDGKHVRVFDPVPVDDALRNP